MERTRSHGSYKDTRVEPDVRPSCGMVCTDEPNVAGYRDIDYYTKTAHCSHPHQCAVNALFYVCGKTGPCESVTPNVRCELYPAGYSTTDVVLFNVVVALFFAACVLLELKLLRKKRVA